MRMHHEQVAEEIWSWTASPPGEEPRTYRMTFPTNGGPWSFPVDGCPGLAVTRTAMQVHFLHRNVHDNVVILEEVKLSHPRFPQCDMLVP